jgi:hypothetical protein
MRYLLLAVSFMLFSGMNTVFAADAGVMISDQWVREAPPNMPMMAGYMTIMNMSKHEQSLVGASSPQFKMVELHRSIEENGMSKMIAQKKVDIPAGKSVEFKPGSYHLMLMHPLKPLKAGDTVEFTLKFSNGDTKAFTAPVKKSNGGHEQMHMHMDMK